MHVAKGDFDLGDLTKEEKKQQKEAEGKYKKFMAHFEKAMEGTLKEVRITSERRSTKARARN